MKRSFVVVVVLLLAAPAFAQETSEEKPLWCAAWVSDTQTYDKGGGEGEILVPLLNALKPHRPKMLLHTGDLIFNWANEKAWRDCLDFVKSTDPPMEFHFCPGNHDVDSDRENMYPWIARAATLGIYPVSTGRHVPGKGYYKDKEIREESGPGWPLWSPEVVMRKDWTPEEGGPYHYVFKRGGIRFIVQDYRNTREEHRNWLDGVLRGQDDSTVSILLQHKLSQRWPHKGDCGGDHNLRLIISGHYPGFAMHGPVSGVRHIRCSSVASPRGGENDIFLFKVFKDRVELDRYWIAEGAPRDKVEGPATVWKLEGKFTDYVRPEFPAVPAVLEVGMDETWFTLMPGEKPKVDKVRVRNLGGAVSNFEIYATQSWLSPGKNLGSLDPTKGMEIDVEWKLDSLKPGIHAVSLRVADPKAYQKEVTIPITVVIDQPKPEGKNLVLNPGAEEGMEHWQTGGYSEGWPKLDPDTYGPIPSNHSGSHRFGVSWGWTTGDCYQRQTVEVEPGAAYEAGFWVSKMNGTDESLEMSWVDGEADGERKRLYFVPEREQINGWWKAHKGAKLTPTGNKVTLVLRYLHPVASNIASIHVDDIYLVKSRD